MPAPTDRETLDLPAEERPKHDDLLGLVTMADVRRALSAADYISCGSNAGGTFYVSVEYYAPPGDGPMYKRSRHKVNGGGATMADAFADAMLIMRRVLDDAEEPMTLDLDKLEQLARAATPGPWVATGGIVYYKRGDFVCAEIADTRSSPHPLPNAAYASAAGPDVVLALIAELRAARVTIAARPVRVVRECRNCGSPNHDECTRKLY